MSEAPLVSICCITYNHSQYIGAAMKGFLMQETGFPVEVIVYDDASTDNTPQIIETFTREFPERIRPFYNTSNCFSKGEMMLLKAIRMARGEYIALCEGDDYWTAPDKLERQVDFLEAHPDYSFCFHAVRTLDESTGNYELLKPDKVKAAYDTEDILKTNFIPTCSVMYRQKNMHTIPEWYDNICPEDWPLHVIQSRFGKIKYIDRVMGVYRQHTGGLWTSMRRQQQIQSNIPIYRKMYSWLGTEYASLIKEQILLKYRHLYRIHRKRGNISGMLTAILKFGLEKLRPTPAYSSSLPSAGDD